MSTLRAHLRSVRDLHPVTRTLRKMTFKYPKAAETLRVSPIYTRWWYYSMELLPGVITRGQYEDTFPLFAPYYSP